MTDNRQTDEAQRVYQDSEFIKRVTDFAEFMQKEYIDGEDERSLIVAAADGQMMTAGHLGIMFSVIGDRRMSVKIFLKMLEQDGIRDLINTARVVSIEADEDMSGVIREKRKRFRVDYGIAVLLGVWTLCLAAMGIASWMHWILTLTNLALMAFTLLTVWREIRQLRRLVKRMEAELRGERRPQNALSNTTKAFLRLGEAMARMGWRPANDDDD